MATIALGKRVSAGQRRGSRPSRNPARPDRPARAKGAERDADLPRDPDVTEAIAVDAARHLFGQAAYKGFLQADTETRIAFLRGRIVANHKLSRDQHLTLLADAYALYAQMRGDPSVHHAVLEAAKVLGRHLNERTSALRLVLELTITYGGEGDAGEGRRAGKLYSRDGAAIKNLIRRGVTPGQLVALGQGRGEGLDRWATWRPKAAIAESDTSMGKPSAPERKLDAPEEPQPAPARPALAIEGADEDGSDPVSTVDRARGDGVRLLAPDRPSDPRAATAWPAAWPNEIVWSKIMPDGQRLIMHRISVAARSDGRIAEGLASLVEMAGAVED